MKAIRFKTNPLIDFSSSKTLEGNINGPSVIRMPSWVQNPLGRYYMYFAHHGGKHIRLAVADSPKGPWKVYEPGVMHLEDAKVLRGHIASPDVHIDEEKKEIIMYVHGPLADREKKGQKTIRTVSTDGLNFTAGEHILGQSYFRVFEHQGLWYALANTGLFFRTQNPNIAWEEREDRLIPVIQVEDDFGVRECVRMRHAAILYKGDHMLVFYTRKEDAPERILCSRVDFNGDWTNWKPSQPVEVLRPETKEEGAFLPVTVSKMGPSKGPVRELRDPAIFQENGKTYLYYSIAGECGISGAEVFFD